MPENTVHFLAKRFGTSRVQFGMKRVNIPDVDRWSPEVDPASIELLRPGNRRKPALTRPRPLITFCPS
jgi:hypothetical protein